MPMYSKFCASIHPQHKKSREEILKEERKRNEIKTNGSSERQRQRRRRRQQRQRRRQKIKDIPSSDEIEKDQK